MKVIGSILFAGAALAASSASAADISYNSATYDWTGFYAGIHGGYGTGQGDSTSTASGLTTNVGLNGALYGVQAGYLGDLGDFVLGIEGSVSKAHLSGATACNGAPAISCQGDLDMLASLEAIAGVPVDNVLFYAKAGVAYTHANLSLSPAAFPGHSAGAAGLAVGAGVKLGVTDELSVGLDYTYMAFQQITAPAGTLAAGTVTVDSHAHVVKASLNYHF